MKSIIIAAVFILASIAASYAGTEFPDAPDMEEMQTGMAVPGAGR